MDRDIGLDELSAAIGDDELSRAVAERGEEMAALNAAPPESGAASEPAKDLGDKKHHAAGHRQRVKERFLKTGLDGFAPHEIIELLLFYAIPMRDTKMTAHQLIDRFGSLSGVLSADVSELTKIPYVTESAAVLLKLIPPLLTAYYADESKGTSYSDTTSLSAMFRPYFVGSSANKFLIACFDHDLHLLSVAEISRGTSAYTSIEMRKILSEVLNSGCAMAALAHNHPGGSAAPSKEDVAVTRRINELLSAVDVTLMDHIIVGGTQTYSMRDGGELGIFD